MGMEGYKPGKRIEDKEKARDMAEAGNKDRSDAAMYRKAAREGAPLSRDPEKEAKFNKAIEEEAVRLDKHAEEKEESAGESYEKYKDV